MLRILQRSLGTVVRKNSTTSSAVQEALLMVKSVQDGVRHHASWADRSDAAGVAPASGNAGVERESPVLTKYVVGRDCNAVATTTEFGADGPRLTG